jgi:hypothetical protein
MFFEQILIVVLGLLITNIHVPLYETYIYILERHT